ncbi:hypothetical protein [Bradyrhizobium arachidis]|uniref:hypothetical protein n=1 Tax=Bradyrhizobium arachidis TaxID=858423 RepID=UPI0021614875|nr:hypothetical protein [Bradyrhizobium arachidis]UVO30331.1 hypothetical protein KUF59_06205 [Bradyrhizobium arachidis]
MKIIFRATDRFLGDVRRDLARPHAFAAERVGFISVRATAAGADTLILLAADYHPLADDEYVHDISVGAMMGQEAIRKALEVALMRSVGMVHVHMHEHHGRPHFSRIDVREQTKFVPDFFKVRREMPHGAVVLSHDQANGRIWLDRDTIVNISEFDVVGRRLTIDVVRPGGLDRLA